MQLPAIDQNVCGQWTAVQKDFYEKLPYYLVKFETEYRKNWATWQTKIVRSKVPWKPNMGTTMRRIAQEYSPINRQEAVPEQIDETPTTDVEFTRERYFDSKLYRHRFQTREFWFLPEFQDFFQHLDFEYENLIRKITHYYESFIRTRIWHHSPYVWVCGKGLVTAPTGLPNKTGTSGKTDAWIKQQIETGPQPLTAENLFKLAGDVIYQIGMTPNTGTGVPNKENQVSDARWKLVCHEQDFFQFANDPWVKENRQLNFDIVTSSFQGSLFGVVKAEFERFPLRFLYEGEGETATISRPDPETVNLAADGTVLEEVNRTRPNLAYERDSQYGVAFWVGGPKHYTILDAGAPPSAFTKSLDGLKGMNWNGKPNWTKKFLINCKDGDGNAQPELNETWGENMRAQAQLAMGIAPDNAFNILPILFQRRVGINTTGTVS